METLNQSKMMTKAPSNIEIELDSQERLLNMLFDLSNELNEKLKNVRIISNLCEWQFTGVEDNNKSQLAWQLESNNLRLRNIKNTLQTLLNEIDL